MNVTYRAINLEDFEQVRQLLIDVGWRSRVEDQSRFAQMMRGERGVLEPFGIYAISLRDGTAETLLTQRKAVGRRHER